MTDQRLQCFHRSFALGALSALGLLLTTSSAAALTLAAAAATDFDKIVAAEGLGEPTDVAVLPDGRIVVIERAGNVNTFTLGTPDPLTDRITVDSSHNERGLLGIVVDPDFATNQFVYFYASQGTDANNRQKILRYKLGTDGKLSALKPVVDMGLKGPANHNGGGISIYGGHMYIGVGDTGANSTPPTNKLSSCLNQANGKILRVSLAEATLGQPPADNPLMNVAMVTGCTSSSSDFAMMAPDKRIFAWGFRNPFRIWADPTSGKIWVGDVGETTREEVTIVDVAKGRHYGYPFWEGTTEYNQAFKPAGACMGMTPASPCIAPGHDYPRASGGSVTGGRIMDGCGWPAAWKSRYIFGDHEQGKIWTVDVTPTRDGIVPSSQKDFATSADVVAFSMGTDNALYVVERGGTVSRITAKAAPAATPGSCLTVAPAPSNGAGGGGAGGASGGGGASAGAPAGGQAPSAGAPASGGQNATAGTSTSTGGTGGTAGQSPGAGAPSGTAGSSTSGNGSTGGGKPDDSGGCGCRVGANESTWAGISALVAALGFALGRRRSRRS
jgi:glucose/arabinose dehydrogenase